MAWNGNIDDIVPPKSQIYSEVAPDRDPLKVASELSMRGDNLSREGCRTISRLWNALRERQKDLERETLMFEAAARIATEHEQRMRAAPRLILDNWEEWDGEAQFDAQREQTPDAYVHTMLGHLYETLGLPDDREHPLPCEGSDT